MVLERLFGRSFGNLKEGEFIELDTAEASAPAGKIPIKIDRMEDFSDSDRIQKLIRDGSVVLIKIRKLKEKDLSELKRAVDKLRKTCVAMNGDIAGIDEDWIICTPAFAHVARS